MAEKPIKASPHLRRYRATGCHTAAIVLERLMWWWEQGTRIVHGEEWRAKPRQQLADECGLSLTKTERALTRMKRSELITTSRHRFGKEQDTVMHYRLLPKALSLRKGTELVENLVSSASGTGAGCLVMANIEVTSLSYGSIEEPTESLVCKKFSQIGISSGKKEPPPSKKLKGHGMVFQKQNAPNAPIASKPTSLAKELSAAKALTKTASGKQLSAGKGTLAGIWIEAFTKTYPNEPTPVLTKKELGQLKNIRIKLEPHDAEQILRKAVASWGDFTLNAFHDAGAFAIPKTPDIGVILKFLAVAANLFLQQKKVVAYPATTLSPALPKSAPTIVVTPEPKASKEQVLALLSKPKGK